MVSPSYSTLNFFKKYRVLCKTIGIIPPFAMFFCRRSLIIFVLFFALWGFGFLFFWFCFGLDSLRFFFAFVLFIFGSFCLFFVCFRGLFRVVFRPPQPSEKPMKKGGKGKERKKGRKARQEAAERRKKQMLITFFENGILETKRNPKIENQNFHYGEAAKLPPLFAAKRHGKKEKARPKWTGFSFAISFKNITWQLYKL